MIHEKIYACLKQAAREERTVEYGDIAQMADLNMDLDKDRGELGRILGDISQYEVEQGHPMLSVVCVLKDECHPSKGFYEWAIHLGRYRGPTDPESEEALEFFVTELKAAYRAWKCSPSPASPGVTDPPRKQSS